MGERRREIGICGTFDVANYGDLLFPLIAESELTERLGAVTFHRFSYNARVLPDWPYEVTAITALPRMIRSLDGLLIGGGHLIRFDKHVAPGYVPPTPEIHHPTGYWLTPALIALQHDVPLVWNAPGIHGNDIPTWANPLLAMALSHSRYVSVRDEPSRLALEPLTAAPVIVVPDTAFGLPRLLNLEGAPSAEFTRLAEASGLEGPYIIVQATLGLDGFVRFIRQHIERFRNFRFLALPIGPVLGDRQDNIDSSLPGVVRLANWPDPLVVAELIGRSEAVVGYSYHLFVTALAAGVPVFTPQHLATGKYSALQSFASIFALPPNGEPDVEWFLARVGRTSPSAASRASCERLRDHWDRIAAAIRAEPVSTAPRLNRFWQSLPSLLENAARIEAETLATLASERAQTKQRLDEVLRQLAVAHHETAVRQRRTDDMARAETTLMNFERITDHRLEIDPYGWASINDLFDLEHAARLSATYPADHFKFVAATDDGEKGFEYEARELVGMGADVISHPSDLSDVWRALANDLLSPDYRAAMSTLTGRDLTQLLMEVNLFHYGPGAFLGPHRDLPDKVVTHVLYFNDSWNTAHGGCLRILRSADPAGLVAEIPPIVGQSAVLVRSEHSWHAVSRVVDDSASSRRSVTVTFYRPGSVSTLWPPSDTDARAQHRDDAASQPAGLDDPRYWVDVGIRDAEIGRLQELLSEQTQWNLQQREHVTNADAEIGRLQGMLAEQIDWNLRLRQHRGDRSLWRRARRTAALVFAAAKRLHGLLRH